MVAASTSWSYNVAFAPHEDGNTIENETLDLMFTKPGKLDLVLTRRAQ
jgi:hypothetical protein